MKVRSVGHAAMFKLKIGVIPPHRSKATGAVTPHLAVPTRPATRGRLGHFGRSSATAAAAAAVTGMGMGWCHRDATLRGTVGAAMIAAFAAIGAGGGKKTKKQGCENSILHEEVDRKSTRLTPVTSLSRM